MRSVVFVHGTGVRQPAFDRTFAEVERRATSTFAADAVPCYWGATCGTQLRHFGKSIPLYDMTLAVAPEPDDAAVELALWRMLYDDPLYELRLFGAAPRGGGGFVPGVLSPLAAMNEALDTLAADDAIAALVAACGLDAVWPAAIKFVRNAKPYKDALKSGGSVSGELRTAIANALVATALMRYLAEGDGADELDDADATGVALDVPFDGRARDALRDAIAAKLGGPTLSAPGTWMRDQLLNAAMAFMVQRKRGARSTNASPVVGDILRYQVRGEDMRAFIRSTIEQAEAPCIVIGHSLGGIACVDMFAEAPIDGVTALVTVGSQASYMYEIDALHSLRWNQPLPAHFPRWINVYDLKDFLSYVGAEIFPDRVVDVEVDNGHPFPESHGAYWWNDDVWSRLKRELDKP